MLIIIRKRILTVARSKVSFEFSAPDAPDLKELLEVFLH